MNSGMPLATKGQRIGLLGGSFDPPHHGHVTISHEAMKRLQLDQLWWLVSPGNPLKGAPSQGFAERMAACRGMLRHPRMHVSDFEMRQGMRYTAQTIARLRHLRHDLRFVWLMGADNLGQFHQWAEWRSIIETVPIAVLARPGQRISARMSPAARMYRSAKLPSKQANSLAGRDAPAWVFLNIPMQDISSTEIRAERANGIRG